MVLKERDETSSKISELKAATGIVNNKGLLKSPAKQKQFPSFRDWAYQKFIKRSGSLNNDRVSQESEEVTGIANNAVIPEFRAEDFRFPTFTGWSFDHFVRDVRGFNDGKAVAEDEVRIIFLGHGRTLADLGNATRVFGLRLGGLFERLPANEQELKNRYLYRHMPAIGPVITGHSNFGIEGSKVRGKIGQVPLLGEQMVESKEWMRYSLDLVADAFRLGIAEGATWGGLGAYTSPVADGGRKFVDPDGNIREKYSDFGNFKITNGNALTAFVTSQQMLGYSSEILGLEPDQLTFGFIGGTGSVGQAVVRMSAEAGIGRLIVFSRDPKVASRKFSDLKGNANVEFTDDLTRLSQCDTISNMTSGRSIQLRVSYFRPWQIVMDDTQPQVINEKFAALLRQYNILVCNGGFSQMPPKFYLEFPFGTPKGTAVSCLAEELVCALENFDKSFSIGNPTVAQARFIGGRATAHGIRPAPPMWGDKFLNPNDYKQTTYASDQEHNGYRTIYIP